MSALTLLRSSLFAAVSIAPVAACGATGQAAHALPSDARAEITRAEINRVLDDWHGAASAADEARYFGHFAPHGVFLGTDATERWDAQAFREYAHPHFARGTAWTFRSVRRAVVVDSRGVIAWFDEDLATENLGPARGSGVLERNSEGRWTIAQYVLSVTIPNDRFSAVRELLREPSTESSPQPSP